MLLREGKKSQVLIIFNCQKKTFYCAQLNVIAPGSVVIFTVYPTGTEVFKRPQKGRKESRQLVHQTGVHQRNPGQNSPVTD